jgi:NAD-dependent deacetylase
MPTDALLARAAGLIHQARHLVVLTGAGLSTASGIPDFRSLESGLWNKASPWVVASLNAFRIRPKVFFDWIRPLVQTFVDAIPNPAHQALAKLEQMGRLSVIITQNIDNLHQKAGSRNVIEVHGDIRKATCVRCYGVVRLETLLPRFIKSRELPRCEKCGGILKPNVILLGEQLPIKAINAARRHAGTCDLMIVAGSSLRISPAADLPYIAHENGAQLMVINQQPTPIDSRAALVIREDVAVVLPLIVSFITPKTPQALDSPIDAAL